MMVFGEFLTGEIRPVDSPENRVREAVNLGFRQMLMPHENHARVQEAKLAATLREHAVEPSLIPVKHLLGTAQMALT